MDTSYIDSSWHNNTLIGAIAALAYYGLGFGICTGLAQFMPVADMCNPGVPLGVGALLVVIGAVQVVVVLIVLLTRNHNRFIAGYFVGHILVLGGIWLELTSAIK